MFFFKNPIFGEYDPILNSYFCQMGWFNQSPNDSFKSCRMDEAEQNVRMTCTAWMWKNRSLGTSGSAKGRYQGSRTVFRLTDPNPLRIPWDEEVYLTTWMVDLYGKCRYRYILYMDLMGIIIWQNQNPKIVKRPRLKKPCSIETVTSARGSRVFFNVGRVIVQKITHL